MKRTMAFLLALVMIVGMVPFGVFAEETEHIAIELTTDAGENLAVGDTFTVTANLTENPGIISFQLELLWNEDVLAFKGTEPNSDWVGATCADKYCTFVWSSAYESTTTGQLFVATFEVIGYGDCGIRNNEEYYEMCNDAYDVLALHFDGSAVSGLSVAEPHVCVYVDNVLKEATCTEEGILQHLCEGCGDQSVEAIPALGHSYIDGVCTVCGADDPDYVAPHEHSYEAVVTDPTCTEGGFTTYTCACGDIYTADETEALGHNYVNGTCEACGEADPNYVTVTYAWYGDGTSASYTISTAEELHQFAAIVNGTDVNYAQDDFSGKTVSLANDIALAEDGLYIVNEDVQYGTSDWSLVIDQFVLKEEAPVWTPIGAGTSSGNGVVIGTSFAGTFDGCGHTVSGVYTGTKDATTCNTLGVQGLFGVVSGTVKNLTVSGCVTGTTVIGGVVAYLNGGTIENCVNNALVFGDGSNKPATGKEEGGSRAGAVGGIVGRAAGTGSVNDCVNNAHIVCANSNKGGRVAGIVGLIDASGDAITTNRNVNNGTIEGYQYVAGIVGMVYSTKSPTDSCINNGDIYGYGTNKTHTGGIVGQYSSVISNCYNTGNITVPSGANAYASHIGGDYGNANPTIINCYTIGNFYGNEGGRHYGIFSGCGKSENCYYLDTAKVATTSEEQGTLTAMTADELKAAADLLNGETGTAWKADGTCVSANNGYPVLAWQECADHIWTDATCTTPKTCTVCGETEGEALGHAYEAVVTEPDCTNGGYTTYTCTVCGDSYVADEVAANGHSYEAVVTEPTCTEGGYTTYTCADCGDSYIADETEALYHDYREMVVDPTCTEQGYTIRKCVDCGHTYNTNYVDALGHTGAEAVTENQVAATCTADAYHDEVVYCAVCAAEVSRLTVTEEGTALGHTWVGGTCAVCGVSNENADKYAWYEAGRETGSYTISTAEELWQLAAIVNGTDANYPLDNFSGKTVTLANDIALAADGLYVDCGEKTFGASSYPLKAHQYVLAEEAPVWTPIGTGTATDRYNNVTTNTAFAGTFDGNGHTVSGVYTGTKDASAPNTATVQGLFGIVTGTVKNLTVSGCVTGRSVVGGVVAYLNGGTIENCVNNAIVFSDGGNKQGSETGGSGAGATGGVVGRAGGVASVTGCVNNASVICANSNKGGRVAGIIGLIDASDDVVTVERNANYGDVTGYQYVAGIVGLNYSKNSPITSCLNTGDIHSWGAQKLHVGGIVGQFDSPVADCYVTGSIYTYWTARTAYVGGVAGDRTTYSGTAGNALTVSNCYFTGSIIYATNDSIASMGMISGDVSANSANNYYLDEGFAASSSHKGAVSTSYGTAMTADELKAATDLLNGETGTAWKADGTCTAINDGYPILAWQTGAVDHDWTDATCTEAKTCTICGHTEGEALGHDYQAVYTEHTCMEDGYTTYTCSRCADSYVVVDEGTATGHCYREYDVAPTCTDQGYTHRECVDCGDTYDCNFVDALGHSYVDGICEVCGEADPNYHEHSYEAVVTEPTCTEGGYTTYTCECGDSYIADETAALGHDYVDGTCSHCGEADPDYEEPSSGNWWDKWFGSWWGDDEDEDPTEPSVPETSEPTDPSDPTEPSEPEEDEDTAPGWGGWFDWIWNFFG